MQLQAGHAPLTIITGTARAVQRGIASWYGRNFHGRATASGERFDMHALSAAHPTLPLMSYVRVRNLENQREVIVRINDRGPFRGGRIIDLSFAAAQQLDIVRGLGNVVLELLSGADLHRLRTGSTLAAVTAEQREPPVELALLDSPAASDTPAIRGAGAGAVNATVQTADPAAVASATAASVP